MFRPIRTSSPSKSSTALPPSLRDDSRTSIPELMGLTPDEVDFIGAVVERAGSEATTFVSVLQAYNEIIRERDWDSQNEVVYYGKLLKLGTLRGRNWGEKWAMVQQQNVYDRPPHSRHASEESLSTQATRPQHKLLTRLIPGYIRPAKLDDDTFTLHSHDDDAESDMASIPETPKVKPRSLTQSITPLDNSFGLDIKTPTRIPLRTSASISSTPRPTRRPHLWESVSENGTDEFVLGSSKKPLPGRSTAVHREHVAPFKPATDRPSRAKSGPTVIAPTASHRAVAKAREQRSGVINEDEPWNKIRMAQDENEADRFRRERLVEQCWTVWRQGYEWSITTQEQISKARDTLILRIALQRWRQLSSSRVDLRTRVAKLTDVRILRRAFTVWTARLAEKRQISWRRDMRVKMKAVREKREAKLCKDVWAKWRQGFRSHLSAQHYQQRLILRVLRKWHSSVAGKERLRALAADFDERRENWALSRAWEGWRRAVDERRREGLLVDRVDVRIKAEVLQIWKKRMLQMQNATDFYDVICMRRALNAWGSARLRIQSMEKKADKHLARQDDVLIRAIVRVWKAHERGNLLERVRTSRLESRLWELWKQRLEAHRQHHDLAVTFSMRQRSVLATTALQTWLRALATKRRVERFADQYYAAHLCRQKFLVWRRALRKKQKIVRAATIAEKYLLVRRTWNAWKERVEATKRDKKVRELDLMRLIRIFRCWSGRVRRQRQLRSAEQHVEDIVTKRLMKLTLGRWTNRVIEFKLREIEIVQKSDSLLLSNTFRKWKGVCVRHAEEVSLLQSYLDVKREETIRRMFYSWINKARSARDIRVTLQEKEEEARLSKLSVAWEKWRDRYKDERLRIVEREVVLQCQRNLLFRSFGVWHSKTNSLPAIHFEASRLRAKVWKRWRNVMPQASLAKMARDAHIRLILTKALSKWTQAYKTKIALKAVARARYLRLPTAVPRQSLGAPRSAAPPSVAVGRAFTRRVLMGNTTAKRANHMALDDSASQASAPATRSSKGGRRDALASEVVVVTDDEVTEAESVQPANTPRLSTSRPFRPASIAGSNGVFSSISRSGAGVGAVTPTPRPRLFPLRDTSPARSRTSSALATPLGGGDASSTKVSLPGSSVTGENGRSRLWTEIRDMQRKSRAPTEASRELL